MQQKSNRLCIFSWCVQNPFHLHKYDRSRSRSKNQPKNMNIVKLQKPDCDERLSNWSVNIVFSCSVAVFHFWEFTSQMRHAWQLWGAPYIIYTHQNKMKSELLWSFDMGLYTILCLHAFGTALYSISCIFSLCCLSACLQEKLEKILHSNTSCQYQEGCHYSERQQQLFQAPERKASWKITNITTLFRSIKLTCT